MRTEAAGGETPRAGGPASFSEGGWVEVPSYHPVVVSALVPGRVEEVLVLEGQGVEKGQVVARIYRKDLEDALRLAEAEVLQARASRDLHLAGYRKEDVERARAEVRRLAGELALRERIRERTAGLVPLGAASPERLEQDETEVETARARLEAAEQELARLSAGFREEEVLQAKAVLARAEAARDLARSRLGYADVESPAAGVVLERFVTPGSWLSTADPRVITLYDPGDLQVRVDVRQENAQRVRIGQLVEVTVEADPGAVYHGRVLRVEPLADLKKNTIQAKVRLEDPGPRLHPEMICRARFVEDASPRGDARDVISIPGSAVVRIGGEAHVFVVEDGRATRVRVRLGEERSARVEVLDGIERGDRVVVAPPPDLEDGGAVREGDR